MNIATNALSKKQALAKLLGKKSELAQETISTFTVNQIQRLIPEKEYYPLSSPQKRLFILEQITERGKTVYNLPTVMEVIGSLNVQKLEEAFKKVIEHYEILRTGFEMVDNQPVQRIQDDVHFSIDYCEAKQSELVSIIESSICSFDLAVPPLLRVKLMRVSSELHYLLLDIHHIISDGKSMNILFREVMKAYEGQPLTPTPIQYRDFVIWQEALLGSSKLDPQKEYWLKQLHDPIPVLDLPSDFQRPSLQQFEGNQFNFTFDATLTNALKQFAAEYGVSLYILLMSIYHVFLHKYSRQEDIIVGSSVEGRMQTELQNIMGMFVNTLPIRCFPSPLKTFEDFLGEVKNVCLEAYANQHMPLGEIIEMINPPRDPTRNPLFDTLFDLHQARYTLTQAGGLVFKPYPLPLKNSKFDLSLEGIERDCYIDFYFEYSKSLFCEDTIQWMSIHFKQLAQEIVKNPKISIKDISLLTDEDANRIFHEFNVPKPLGVYPSFLELFRQTVAKTPDRIAIVCDTVHLSYKQIDNMSSSLAAFLIQQNFKYDQLAAFVMERGVSFLISMLAVFKAGGAYVPIDPTTSLQRIADLIQESESEFVLTDQDESFINQDIFRNKKIWNVASILTQFSLPIEPLEHSTHSRQLAYVIFTSGSTGKPKGVMVEHEGMVNHLFLKRNDLGLTSDDVIAQTSSQTFDVSVWQFLVALLDGGKVVVFKQESAWEPNPLLTLLEKERATVFETVPSHMYLILDELESNPTSYCLNSLRWLMLNGEALLPHLCSRWFTQYPDIPLINAYGPTECSDDVTHYFINEPIQLNYKYVPLGKIMPSLCGYILDQYFTLTPVGLYGDLYIQGIGVSRGYLKSPDKTAASFLPFPFSTEKDAGARMYYTGDITRYLSEANIEYMGRKDNQIKIRGQRIELNEIESILNEHETIQQAVVNACSDGENNKYLVAYIARKDHLTDENGLENYRQSLFSYLETRLPKYGVPSAYVILKQIPLLPNGKVNRKALPNPSSSHYIRDTNFTAPRSDLERKLVDLWQEVLGREGIGIHDNFFHLGGHSLVALQLIARIHKALSIQVPLKNLFESPTIAEQVEYIQKVGLNDEEKMIDDPLPVVVPDIQNRYEVFPLTEVQKAYWLGRSGVFALGEVSVHVYSEYDSSTIDVTHLEKSWNLMIQRHEALRMVMDLQGMQKILAEVPYYSIEIYDLSRESIEDREQKLKELRTKFSHEIFPADQWPLFRLTAANLGNKVRIYLSFDSLMIDGGSVDIIFNEWLKLYQNLKASLPPLELSFRDYVLAAEQIKSLNSYARHKKYWISRLTDFPLAPQLFLVKNPQEIKNQTFARCSKRFPRSLWNKLQQTIKNHHLSPTGFLAAVFAEVLYHYSGSSRFAINLTLFDRLFLHPQVNNIAGDFTSLTLLEVDFRHENETILERIKRLQNQLWSDLDHHLYSGVEFLRELAHQYSNIEAGTLLPVVFTSVLGLNDEYNDDIARFFGDEVYSISQTPQVWLDYKAYEVDGDLVIEWDYVSELFAPQFIDNMHESYCKLLHFLVKDESNWGVSKIDLSIKEQQESRQKFNDTNQKVSYSLIHHPFNDQVKKTPTHPAVISDNKILNYKELYEKSNQLGNYFRLNGAKPNQLIAVILRKGWEQVVSCLGILNSGAAYLPIDPTLPIVRLDELLNIAQPVGVIVAKNDYDELLSVDYIHQLLSNQVVVIDDPSAPFHECSTDELLPAQTIDDLAYVIFTSGSTGVPKGVMIEHKAAMNTIQEINQQYGLNGDDRVLALSNLNFDLSVYDIFGLLAVGGTIVFPSSERLKDPIHWVELILQYRVNIWNTVPMFMQMFMEAIESLDPNRLNQLRESGLRLVLLSGDWIPVTLPQRIYAFYGQQADNNLRIVSLGGATEVSIWSISYEIKQGESFAKSIPYGTPLKNQQVYVLNSNLEHCPDWVTGDLYIGGEGLARGYMRDEERTTESFIQHPYLGRLYKTGDIGRYLSNQLIEFLGRNDFQVKIGGHRVELEEITAILNKHEDILQSFVTCHLDSQGYKQLLAYVVPYHTSEVVEWEGMIIDPIQRMEFKLACKGVRHFSESVPTIAIESIGDKNLVEREYFARKSYRVFEGTGLTSESLHCLFGNSFLPASITQKTYSRSNDIKLNNLLQLFAALKINEHALKYRYASAGSLYPVQLYIRQVVDNEEIYYYYDPVNHWLKQLHKHPVEKNNKFVDGISFYFVAHLSAIEPLYGPLSKDFCMLETGYMLGLLNKQCNENGYQWIKKSDNSEDIFDCLKLSDNDFITTSIDFNGFSTIENFPEEYRSDIEVVCYINPDAILGLKGGWYKYEFGMNRFEFLTENEPFHLSPEAEDNYAIQASASGCILFLAPSVLSEVDRNALLLQVGSICQNLMDRGVDLMIGACPIGMVDLRVEKRVATLFPKTQILHGLFFGSINTNQIDAKNQSKITEGVFVDQLNEYLLAHLPKYMIPSHIIILDKLPLSINGKIDQKSLPKPVLSISNRKIIGPQNEMETRILNIWSSVLNLAKDAICIFDNFFELGGNSLLIIQVYNKVNAFLDRIISIDKYFQHPTINSLAEFLSHEGPLTLNSEKIELSAERQRHSRMNKKHKKLLR